MSNPVVFNSNDLEANVPGLKITATDPFRPPVRKLEIEELAEVDKSALTAANYKQRKIHVLADLGRDDKADMELGLMELQGLLQGKEKSLRFMQAGALREYTATLSNVAVVANHGGYAELDMEFICSDPFGYKVSTDMLYNYPNLVGDHYSFAINWPGPIAQTPIVTLTVNTVSGGANGTIIIGNPNKSQQIEIPRTWTDGDVLLVNFRTGDVTVNGTAVDFDGPLLEFDPGNNPLEYEDDFTARNFAIAITNNQRTI